MEIDKSQPSELFKKILLGMTRATKKLVEESATSGRSLVVSIDGKVQKVPANELLSKFPHKG
ncbi:MAG TPA: hypothetical protein VFE32_20860 [Puia sp.]|jgi:hypothetical protein|nr:hypothetical protein [Puia sp.]